MSEAAMCPFCDDDYAYVQRDDKFFGALDYYYVLCQECRARAPEARTRQEAIDAWNRASTERND